MVGDSVKVPDLEYRVRDHQRYIDAFLDAVLPSELLLSSSTTAALLSALTGPAAKKIASQTSLLRSGFPLLGNWEARAPEFRATFQNLGTPGLGRKMILEDNFFVETILSRSVFRGLTEEEYRRRFLIPADREPT